LAHFLIPRRTGIGALLLAVNLIVAI